ncbi:DUF2807 domain-containing protein [Massilia eurypsychrophila]|jgi:hypothetical protein|uniref:DUF2807 domain-containing protein n=1 Tax=Massilia eurypsychrophila TaxID=1485217 RepID=A0A2G8TCY9_9BURK|nr:head GIN domain-containing protein [Massilia eurypsychrophila]PIL43921.1 DUF2807 domain-containing protein [Massilia eurypsychrophila]
MNTRLTRPLNALMLALCSAAIVVPAAPALAGSWNSERVRGSGQVKTEARALGHFNGVALALPGSVELRIGNTESITVETDDNLLPLIDTVVENGTLKIRAARRNVNFDTRRMKFVVQAKGVETLAVDGSGSINADALRGSKVTVAIGGSGSINVKSIDSESLSVNIGGSGDLKVHGGAAKRLSVAIAGSGDVDMGRLQSTDASVNIAGSGDATIAVRDQLKVIIAGSGDVNYYGDPRVSTTVGGSGSAIKLAGAPR